MKFKRVRVNCGNSHDSLMVPSSECQRNGNSNKCRSRCLLVSGSEIIDILKKIKDADPADSHHAQEWKERQRSRMEGLRSKLLMWRLSPESMRDDLENIYMLLFRFDGNGFQLALCSVSWLATRESVVLVPDPIVSAPWYVLLDRGELCDSCQDTPHVMVLCFTKYWWENSQKSRA